MHDVSALTRRVDNDRSKLVRNCRRRESYMIPAMTIPPRESEMQEAGRAHLIPSDLVPERAGVVAFLGNQTRGGDWMLPRLFRAVAALGSVTIDLTRVRVGPGTSHIEVRS